MFYDLQKIQTISRTNLQKSIPIVKTRLNNFLIRVNISFHFLLFSLPRQQKSTFSEISIFKTRYLSYSLSGFKTDFRFVISITKFTKRVYLE